MNAILILDLILAGLEKSPRVFALIATLQEQGELTPEQADAYRQKFYARMEQDHWKTDAELAQDSD